jgi:hypothetical protein
VFVVADQAPVEHQDPVRLLHDPPLDLRDEAFAGRIALNDLDVDAVLLAVVADAILEPLVGQGFTHRVGLGGHAVQQRDTGGVVVRTGRQDCDRDDEAQNVHGQASLAARHLLRRVLARRGGRDADGGMDTLRVQDDPARVG